MRIKTVFAGVLITLPMTGCTSLEEMPFVANVVHVETGQSQPTAMRAAARATLDHGYTHFKFQDDDLQQGSLVTSKIGSSASTTGSSGTTLVHGPTATSAATVVMFRANEPGAQGAFDAEQVLRQDPQ